MPQHMTTVKSCLVVHTTDQAALVERPNKGQLWVPLSLCTQREHPVPTGRYGEGYYLFLDEVATWFVKKHHGFFN
ncbi:MAG: hypothetical protein ACWGQW_03155 [bacterium]